MLYKNGNERNKNPKGRATLKSTSLSGFGEKRFYIENIPRGRFLFQGEFSLYKIIPWGEFLHVYRKTSVGEDSPHRKPSGENVFYIENLPGGLFSVGACFSLWYLCGCCNDVDCFGVAPFLRFSVPIFFEGMISAIMIWGSRNINIAKFIFRTSMWVPKNAPTRFV